MPTLFWDASGLAKRYAAEVGSEVTDALFALVPANAMLTTVWGYAETFSILLRGLNGGRLDQATFVTASAALKREIISDADVDFLAVDEAAVLAGLPLMQRHNINATDAALLAVLLRYVLARPMGAAPCVLVAADKRLIRAALAEGLITLNPELLAAGDVPALLASL